MKITFNKKHFIAFLLLILTEVAIAYFLKSGFIRHTVGDFLVVILMYCFLRSFTKMNSLILVAVTLSISYIIEFLQMTSFLEVLGWKHNRWANLIFGNSFSVQDLVAYTLGVAVVYYIDQRNFLKN